MRVGILGIQHESNSFVDRPTTLADFQSDLLLRGAEISAAMASAHHEVGGFLASLARPGVESVPLFFARALPGGVIDRGASDRLTADLLSSLAGAGPLDGLLVAAHGAAIAAEHPDFDGHWMSCLRRAAGGLPIVCTIDPHANASPAMVGACEAMIAYRTNPHIDQRQCGIDAAELLLGAIAGKTRPTTALAMPPMIINIDRQRTAIEPCASLYVRAAEIRARPGVLSASVVLGFPYADVEEMGAAFIATTDADPALARNYAEELASYAWERRGSFAGNLRTIDAALDEADAAAGLCVLLDMGDNVGGGSPGDGTLLAQALCRRPIGPAIVTLFDPAAVANARAAGTGVSAMFVIGGRTDPRLGPPLTIAATVVGLYDGKFTESQPRHGGASAFDMGDVAMLQTAAGLQVIVTSRRLFPVSLNQFPCVGIDPARAKIIIVKGVHAPAAAYEAIASRLIHVNTPGPTAADLSAFLFQHRRRPLFPLEPDTMINFL